MQKKLTGVKAASELKHKLFLRKFMTKLTQLRYLHWDLGSALKLCARFLEQTRQAYAQLGELDRFEPVSILRDIAEKTRAEVAPTPPPKPETKGFVWEKKK